MANITCPIITAAQRFRSEPAIITPDIVMSYEQLDAKVEKTSARLKKEGIGPGERVAIVSWNNWEYIVVIFALIRIGAVACPISPRFPVKGIGSILRKIDGTVLIHTQKRPSSERHGPSRHVDLWALFEPDKHRQTRGKNNLAVEPVGEETREMALDLDRPATIVLTSGTTATPKAVLHSYGNHYFNALGANENIPIKPGNRWLLSLPLFHVGGLGILFRTVLAGGTIVVPAAKKSLGGALEAYEITHLSVVATQLYRLLRDGIAPRSLERLHAVLAGGGPVPPSLIQRAHEIGMPLYLTYGSTEMASQITTTAPDDLPGHRTTCGKVLLYRQLKIQEEEILVKGKTLFQGYVVGESVRCAVDNQGWYHTGDMGTVDSAGYVTVSGRRDHMFISGGENIFPEEIERCLCSVPEVFQAIVVPVENDEFGYRPVVFVETSARISREEKKWIAHLEKHLPRFKIPQTFYPWPEKSALRNMKPDRNMFRKRAKALAKSSEIAPINEKVD